jgi:hypothetical protein
MFPVVKITRPFLGEKIVFLASMIGCEDPESAVAAFPKEPGDEIEFAWWDVPREPVPLSTLAG